MGHGGRLAVKILLKVVKVLVVIHQILVVMLSMNQAVAKQECQRIHQRHYQQHPHQQKSPQQHQQHPQQRRSPQQHQQHLHQQKSPQQHQQHPHQQKSPQHHQQHPHQQKSLQQHQQHPHQQKKPTAAPTTSPPTKKPTAAPTTSPPTKKLTEAPTTSPPTKKPTAAPIVPVAEIEKPTSDKTKYSAAGAKGDPHFKLWDGKAYDFHGVCDLVLLHNPEFNNGLGMDIHIRTKKMKHWSYIKTAVIRIGNESFEVMAERKHNYYWNNRIAGDEEIYTMKELPATISGYNIQFRKINSQQLEYTIVIGNNKNNNNNEKNKKT